jgi:hypothetical protein
MDDATLQNLRSRADAKLRYAEIHLDELRRRTKKSGSDFERAFEESFLFHLLGAKEAFLIELNEYYKAGLKRNNVTLGALREALRPRGVTSQEVGELYQLENNQDSWLFQAKDMRDHSTHVANVSRVFHEGGSNHLKIFFRSPTTGKHIDVDVLILFDGWLIETRGLIEKLRKSALSTTGY